MKINNILMKKQYPKNKSGFVFAVAALGVSLIVGLIVVFMFNTVTLETTTASKTFSARIAFWKALSRVRMLEQLIKDYGFNTVSNGGIIGGVTFFPIDDCHRRVVSEIHIGTFTRKIQGILENQACDAEQAPDYSMVFRVSGNSYHPGRGHCRGWRHWGIGRGFVWWGWRVGSGSCSDIWRWRWSWNGLCDDDDHGDDHGDNHGDDHGDDDEEQEYGLFQIKGWSGKLDGEVYIGANTYIEHTPWNTKPHVGWNDDYDTNFKVPTTCSVIPSQPMGQNDYTWENVAVEDLPDFDHISYDSLFAIAENMTHDPANGKYVGNIHWPYDGQWGNTTIFHLQDYPNRTLFVRGRCTIKWCDFENQGGGPTLPGIIVATDKIRIESIHGGTVPNNIILITKDDIELRWTNFGTVLPQQQWDSVVNELYAREQIKVIGGNRVFAQIYAFGGGDNHYSYRSIWTNTLGLLYAPNPDNYIDLARWKWFKGAMYVNRVKYNRFRDNYVLFHRLFPNHYFPGGVVGLYGGGADLGGTNWVMVTGSIQEI